MQYALVNGNKTTPLKGLNGICPSCHKDVIPKCGSIKVHHWAHKKKDCDPWSEPETEWHRNWKNQFPESFREISFEDGDNFHRADIYTSNGVTIEFQNSSISPNELISREQFYEKLIWVVNAAPFQENFRLTCDIPDPESSIMDYYSVLGIGEHNNKLMLKHPAISYELSLDSGEFKEVETLYNETKGIYWMFDWKYKRQIWLSRASKVFFDFGGDDLYWLKSKKQYTGVLHYMHRIKKKDFIKKYSN